MQGIGDGIRPGWRPGSWTLRYGFIRAASSPAESPPAEGGSVDLPGMTPHGLSRPVAASAAHLPWISTEERGGIEPQRFDTPSRFRGGACNPGRFTLRETTALPPGVNRREMAEDGEIESHPAGPPGFQSGPATWLVHPPRKAADSNGTVLPAHPLATEPGPWPVHLP